MAGLGYEIDGDNIYVRFGDYTDIHDSHTPDPECPMPENERLANYTMRLLAMLDISGWRLVQAVPADQKNPPIHALRNGAYTRTDLSDIIGNLNMFLADIASNIFGAGEKIQGAEITAAVEELEGELITMEATLAGMLLAYGAKAIVDETNWGLLLTGEAAIVASLAAMDFTLAGWALSGWSSESIALITQRIAEIKAIIDAGLIKDEKPLLDEIDQTLQAEDAAEQILNLQGETSVYFKSRTVRD
jgi:hypothetical protein